MIVSYTRIGRNNTRKRLWLESPRLLSYGFQPGTFLDISQSAEGVTLRAATAKTPNRVSRRSIALKEVPLIDLTRASLLDPWAKYEELKVTATVGRIHVQPTRRAFHIRKHIEMGPPWATMEYFCGGGTISDAFHKEPRFRLAGACELEPRYAHCFATKYPDTPLFQADIRDLDPTDLEPMAVIFGSLPCECFSSQGVAKKGLKGKNELGHTGDLFIPFLHAVNHHMPLAVIIENVPAFQTSLAGMVLMEHLRRMNYHVCEIPIHPYDQWEEIQDRKRFVMIATRKAPFLPHIPMTPFTGTAAQFLDAPNPKQDQADAEKIKNSITGRKAHMARHREKGNGFGFSTIHHGSSKVPTLLRSYYKINIGPFVETPYGLRMLRQHEAERLMGSQVDTQHYPTAIQLLGQGVQTRIFTQLFQQLADFLQYHHSFHLKGSSSLP